MIQWNPYLTFNGNCEEAFKFYEGCLGGKIVAMIPFGDTPGGPQAGPEFANKIMHGRLMVGNQVLMGSDAHAGHPYEGVKGCSVAMQVDTPDEAERLFKALSAQGMVILPIQETFWAVRFGMFVDQYGVPWMINCEKPR